MNELGFIQISKYLCNIISIISIQIFYTNSTPKSIDYRFEIKKSDVQPTVCDV